MINIERIEIHNFNSISDIELEFKNGVYLILGKNYDSDFTDSNGSGKSSVIEALVYALYGKSSKKNHQRKGTNDTYVKLYFYDSENNYYELTRYYKHRKHRNSIELIVNGEQYTYHTKKEVEFAIQSIIKMPYQAFVSSIVILQGFPVKLLLLSPTERKDFFLSLIDFDFDEKLKQFKVKKMELENLLSIWRKNESEVREKISYIEGKLSAMKESAEDIEVLAKECERLEEEVKTLEEEVSSKKKQIRAKEIDIVERYTKLKNRLKEIEEILEKGVCPLCKSTNINADLETEKQQIISAIKEIADEKIYLNKEKEELSSFEEELDKKKKEYHSLKGKLDIYNIQKSTEEDLQNLEKYRKSLDLITNKIIEIEDDINNLNSLIKLLSPSGELRNLVISNYVEMFNSVLETVLENLQADKFKFILTDKGLEIEGIEYENLSGGEKRKYDLITQLAYSDFLTIINSADFNIRIYDEVFDGLDRKAMENILNYIINAYDDKSFYIVSHNEQLKSIIPNTVVLEKRDGITTLQSDF